MTHSFLVEDRCWNILARDRQGNPRQQKSRTWLVSDAELSQEEPSLRKLRTCRPIVCEK